MMGAAALRAGDVRHPVAHTRGNVGMLGFSRPIRRTGRPAL